MDAIGLDCRLAKLILYGSLFKLANGTRSNTSPAKAYTEKTLCVYAILLAVMMITKSRI